MIAEHISSVSQRLGICTLPLPPTLMHSQVCTHMVVTKSEENYLMLCDYHH